MDEKSSDTLALAKRLQADEAFNFEQSHALARVICALLQNRDGCPDYVLQEWMMTELVQKAGFTEAQAAMLTGEFCEALKKADLAPRHGGLLGADLSDVADAIRAENRRLLQKPMVAVWKYALGGMALGAALVAGPVLLVELLG